MAEYMYGVRENGSTVSINDLDDMEVGLRCKCKCPLCHRNLQACALLENNKRSRYFRHHNEGYNRDGIDNLNGCTATSANESGLHMMAKELIWEINKIVLPAMSIGLERLNLQFDADILSQLPQDVSLQEEFVFAYSNAAEIEKTYAGFRPDVSVTDNGSTLLIEIAVTHKVGVDKQKKVEEYGLPMLEIDLSDYVEVGITREALRKILSEETKQKRWISIPRALIDAALQKLSAQADSIKKQKEEGERQRAALAKQRAEYFTPNIYASTLRVNRDDFAFEKYAEREFQFKITRNNYPFFIDIPISGEVIFRCDRRIWQGKIFNRWVYFRKDRSDGPPSINTSIIWDELTKRHKLPINPLLNDTITYPGEDEPICIPKAVIQKYLQYLEGLGFISIEGEFATVLEKHSLTPPNGEYAAQLQEILQQVDRFSPSVSMQIGKKRAEHIRAEWERQSEMQRREEAERRKREEAERKAAIEAAEKRRKEEAAHKAAENAQRQEEDAIRQEMQRADYDQNDYIVYDRKGRQWIKCKHCQKAVLFNAEELSSYDTKSKNKGKCFNCRFRG